MHRIVIDTNCLLAILPSRSPYHKVWDEFLEEHIELCVSTEILLEYEEIQGRKTSERFADIVLKTLLNKRNLIQVNPMWRFHLIVSDVDDNKFVDCALWGDAEFLVPNDTHFKILKSINLPHLSLVSIQEFVKKL